MTATATLSIVVTRACPDHGPECELHRTIEDLGIVAEQKEATNGIARS